MAMQSYIRRTFTALSFILFTLFTFAQTFSGKVQDQKTKEPLGFANIDIYQGDKLIAATYADKDGKFKLKLDSGSFLCEVNYVGSEPFKQEFKLTTDINLTINLKVDQAILGAIMVKGELKDSDSDSDEPAMEVAEIAYDRIPVSSTRGKAMGVSTSSKRESSRKPSDWIMPDLPDQPQVGSGLLTAGEVNDFSKWKLWTDLAEGELSEFQSLWKLAPSNRFMFEAVNAYGIPLANIKAELISSSGNVVYTARTDNTGKAELWSALLPAEVKGKFTIRSHFAGQSKELKAKAIGKGENRVVFDEQCEQSQVVDIAFVVDATGSMGDELEFLKAELNDVMFKAKQHNNGLNFRFANVFYRDHSDEYLTKIQDFTRVLSESANFISQQRADGGGDFPEAVEVALDSAINALSWSEDARTRMVFLVLDAPPHVSPEINAQLKRVIEQAAANGVRIVPIAASGIDKSTEYLMRSMALFTNGTYTFLTDHSGIGGSHIEPSTDSYDVELLNNLMVRIIKSFTYMPTCEQELPDLELPFADSIVQVPTADSSTLDSSDNPDINPRPEPVVLQWKYYPNPTYGVINIVANQDIDVLDITDLSGKLVQQIKGIKAQQVVQANLYGKASGIYLIRYPLGKRWVSGKVVLLR